MGGVVASAVIPPQFTFTVVGLAAGVAPTVVQSGSRFAPSVQLGIPAGATGPAPPLGSQTPTAVAAAAVVGTATNASREDHVHSLPALAVNTPARTLNSAGFQVSATKWALVSYTIKNQVTNPLIAGSSTATVQLMSDTGSTPTTVRGTAEAVSSVALAVAIAITTSNTTTLTYLVPPAHYVRLVGATSGTATNTLVAQVEELIG